jgi:hypothetical protein
MWSRVAHWQFASDFERYDPRHLMSRVVRPGSPLHPGGGPRRSPSVCSDPARCLRHQSVESFETLRTDTIEPRRIRWSSSSLIHSRPYGVCPFSMLSIAAPTSSTSSSTSLPVMSVRSSFPAIGRSLRDDVRPSRPPGVGQRCATKRTCRPARFEKKPRKKVASVTKTCDGCGREYSARSAATRTS